MTEQSAEQKVRAVWKCKEPVQWHENYHDERFYHAEIAGVHLPCHRDEHKAWLAALAFTEERLEEVRQLREEIYQKEDHISMKFVDVIQEIKYRGDEGQASDDDYMIQLIRDLCAYCRTLLRLESILAEKSAGMRPEAIA